MPYTPNATDSTEPTASRELVTAAEEFRALKGSVNTRLAVVEATQLRTVRVPESTVGELPIVATRRGKFFAFDAAGSPTVASGTGSDAALRGDLAETAGTALVGYDGGTAQDVLDSAKPMQSYTALRAYTGRATSVRITTPDIAGFFRKVESGVDNGGTVIVGVFAWERVFSGCANVSWFGSAGDGVTDDSSAVQAALNSQHGLDWGGLTYRITSTITHTNTRDVYWEGRGATIVYDGAHVERAVLLLGGGIEYAINNITVDGGKLCNKPLEIDNNTDSYSNLICNNVFVTRAKRLNTFSGGSGMLVRGAFNAAIFNGGGAIDCELPTGQGTMGTVGISGIAGTWHSEARYIRRFVVNGVHVEKIYSSDLSYAHDQDGIVYFTPTATGTNIKLPGDFVCHGGSRFVNCYGRSIKTQCRSTFVTHSHFSRNDGLTSGVGNTEINFQTGSGVVRDCSFNYSNSQQPSACVQGSPGAGVQAGLIAKDNEVYVASGTTLSYFAQTFPSPNIGGNVIISGNKFFGAVIGLLNYLCNGDKNNATIESNYLTDVAVGDTSERAMVYVRSSGSVTPYFARLRIFDNYYTGIESVSVKRDAISGVSMNSRVSARGNIGFIDERSAAVNSSGLLRGQALAVNRIRPDSASNTSVSSGFLGIETRSISNDATEVFEIANLSGSLIVFQAAFASTAYALFSSTNSTNTAISVGAAVQIGNTTEPASGTFRIWSNGSQQLNIKNTSGSSRTVTILVLCPNA